MKKLYCDQTKQEINGAAIRAAIFSEPNQALTEMDERRIRAIADKEFCSLVALANYILEHHREL